MRWLIADRVRIRYGNGIEYRSTNGLKTLKIVLKRWCRNDRDVTITENYVSTELLSL